VAHARPHHVDQAKHNLGHLGTGLHDVSSVSVGALAASVGSDSSAGE
jgi:hypothetical protein